AVEFESMHGGDPDDAGTRAPNPAREPARAESQVEDLRRVSPFRQRGRDVLEPERLDTEERSEPESLVAGVRPEEKDVHRKIGNCIVVGRCETGGRRRPCRNRRPSLRRGRGKNGSATGSPTPSCTAD